MAKKDSLTPHLSFVYDRHKRASSKKAGSVELRITYNRQQKYISTGIMLLPKEWKNSTVVKRPDSQLLNQQLWELALEVRQVLMDMENSIDIFRIPEELDKRRGNSNTFYDFIEQRIKVRCYGKSQDSVQRYKRFFRLFKQWGKIKSFDDVTESNIITYDKHLASTGMKNYSKWQNYHRFLNSFILDAIDAGFMAKNPYKWVNIDKDKDSDSLSRCLTPEEFKKLIKAKMPIKSLERVKDLFIFQTYTCLSYHDLRDFDASKITDVKGTPVYTGKRVKTGKAFTIPLLQPALDILHKYQGRLPIISNVKYNEYLKEVSKASGINKPITTHWARHTGATLLLNEGVPMQVVSRICGHSSTRMTEQIYAKLLDETVVDAVMIVKGKISFLCLSAFVIKAWIPS